MGEEKEPPINGLMGKMSLPGISNVSWHDRSKFHQRLRLWNKSALLPILSFDLHWVLKIWVEKESWRKLIRATVLEIWTLEEEWEAQRTLSPSHSELSSEVLSWNRSTEWNPYKTTSAFSENGVLSWPQRPDRVEESKNSFPKIRSRTGEPEKSSATPKRCLQNVKQRLLNFRKHMHNQEGQAEFGSPSVLRLKTLLRTSPNTAIETSESTSELKQTKVATKLWPSST